MMSPWPLPLRRSCIFRERRIADVSPQAALGGLGEPANLARCSSIRFDPATSTASLNGGLAANRAKAPAGPDNATACRRYFPLRVPRIPCGPKYSRLRHPALRSGPSGASVPPRRPAVAIEAAMVAGSRTGKEIDMANIGTFTKTAKGYTGKIVTMSVQQKKVRIEAETDVQNDKAPTHRVFVGRAEIGAGWAKRSNEGRDYLSLKLDDPSFAAPIYANLFDDEDGTTYNLIWSRTRPSNGD
jgi:uncharacterized protein (DUF736 family)